MIRSKFLAGAVALVVLGGMGGAALSPAMAQDPADLTKARAAFVNGQGVTIGMAELIDTPGGVLIQLDVANLPPAQWVAFHIHEHGTCDPAGGHESAGGHFNPAGVEHGYLAAKGAHLGDMPNQYVAADGTLKAQVFNAAARLGDGENGITGRTLMFHAKPDDYATQPSGGAGERIACAVIE